MPHGVHEVRIEQARGAGHRQNEAVGLDNLVVDAMHIVAVAGIGGQVLERIVVVDESHRITLEAVIPDEAVILEHTEIVPTKVIERLTNLLLQGEVESATLEAALVIHSLDPRLDIVRCAPELADRESGPHRSVIIGEMLGLKATRIVITEADVAQLILEVVQIGDNLLLCSGVVMVDVTRPGSLARVTATVGVAAAHATLVIPADVPALAVLVPFPLDAVVLSRCGTDDVDFIDKVGSKLHALVPSAQSTLMVRHHILHGASSGSLVGADEVNQLGLGAEVALGIPCRAVDVIGLATVMVEVEHGHKAHTIRVVDDIPVTGAYP